MKYYILLLCAGVANIHTRSINIHSMNDFYYQLDRYPKLVLYAYDQEKSEGDKSERRQRRAIVRRNLDVMRRTSDARRYREGKIAFVTAALERGNLEELKQSYAFQNLDNFALFDRGQKRADKQLNGPITRYDLEHLIEKYFNASINAAVAEKDREREERAEERRLALAYWGGPGWGYPWYYGPGWGYPYYGPGWSFGVSVGI